MAGTFAEDFASHGTGTTSRTNMLNSVAGWTNLGASVACTDANPRYSGRWSLLIPSGTGNARHSLGGAKTTWGAKSAYWVSSYPATSNRIATCFSQDGTAQFSLFVFNDGSARFYLGTSTTTPIGSASAAGSIPINSYPDVEIRATMGNSTAGSCYLYVNGVQKIAATGIDNCSHASATEASTIDWAPAATADFGIRYLADVVANDDSGAEFNSTIGVCICYPLRPNGNTAQADWAVVGAAGGGYQSIDDTEPDGSTTAIEATAAGQISVFDLEDPPSVLTNVRGVVIVSNQNLDTPGTGAETTQLSLLSGSAFGDGAARVISHSPSAYLRYLDWVHTDPATSGGEWEVASLTGMQLQIARTA